MVTSILLHDLQVTSIYVVSAKMATISGYITLRQQNDVTNRLANSENLYGGYG